MRAQESKRLPVVLSVDETRKLLMVMTGEEAVICKSRLMMSNHDGRDRDGCGGRRDVHDGEVFLLSRKVRLGI